MSTSELKKLSILQKLAVGSTVFFFIVGIIIGSIFLFLNFDFNEWSRLVGTGIFFGGLFGSIIIGSYVKYRFGISNG